VSHPPKYKHHPHLDLVAPEWGDHRGYTHQLDLTVRVYHEDFALFDVTVVVGELELSILDALTDEQAEGYRDFLSHEEQKVDEQAREQRQADRYASMGDER
jgi:hypothetical protein